MNKFERKMNENSKIVLVLQLFPLTIRIGITVVYHRYCYYEQPGAERSAHGDLYMFYVHSFVFQVFVLDLRK